MFQKAYRTLAPFTCSLCDTPSELTLDLCNACYIALPHNQNCCRSCARPLKPSNIANETTISPPSSAHPLVCGACLSVPGPICRAIVPLLYRPPVDFMVKRLKYSNDMKFSRLAGELIANAVESSQNQHPPSALLPVPLHQDRLLERGHNQSLQIARIIGSRLGIPVADGDVERTISQVPQAGLNARERDRNIKRAFSARSQVPERVAIIDDVYTTGATANSLATTLLNAGAEEVSLWAFARTP